MVLFLNFLIIYFTLSLENTVNIKKLSNINSSLELLDNNVKVMVVKIGKSLSILESLFASRAQNVGQN